MERGGVVTGATHESVAERLRTEKGPFRLVGSGTKSAWAGAAQGEPFILGGPSGIVDWHPADMVAVVAAGTPVRQLQAELGACGQCLPLLDEGLSPCGTVAGEIAMDFPHRLEGRYGGWRDWVLGVRAVLADGTVFRSGSRAVKNVAGYDLHRLMVGSRGTLAVLLEVVLRTYPRTVFNGLEPLATAKPATSVIRVPRTAFDAEVENVGGDLIASDRETGTIWASRPLPSPGQGWVMKPGEISVHPTQIRFMKRAKQIFDPTNKLNPGEWGFM